MPLDAYGRLPVNLNGDGWHETVRGAPVGDRPGDVLDRFGQPVGAVPGRVAMARKILGRPGEQLVVYAPNAALQSVGNAHAEDTPAALERYASRYYRTCRAGGVLLGGR